LSQSAPAAAVERLFLFVCSGNTCRSPMAEAIARAELAARFGRRPPLQVLSAGLSVRDGAPMTEEAEVALRSLAVEPGRHRARPLTRELVERAEAVYCMTASQRQAVLRMLPEAAGKTACVDPEGDVPDPIGSALPVYESCARRLRELVRARLAERLAEA
jgi:protein-tyrosine-phosphatase